ncbi:hypothetical protein [Streptomyces enissocaesilis]
MTLRGLCQDTHEHLTRAELINALDTAFQELPEPVHPPQCCYQQLIRGGTERLPLAQATAGGSPPRWSPSHRLASPS